MHGQPHIEKISVATFFDFNLLQGGNKGWGKHFDHNTPSELSSRCIFRREKKVQSGPAQPL